MDKAVNVEERIRRAEEIYQRRKINGSNAQINTVTIGNRPDFSLFKKIIIKIFICVFLYFLLYFIKNSNNFFSEELINKTKEILSYDINFQVIYDKASKYFGNILYEFQNISDENQDINNQKYEEKDNYVEQNQNDENTDIVQDNLNQMDLDAKYIKENYKIIMPLEGIITSKFGLRTATNIISANHEGIDIGANEGTEIKAAMDGKVIVVSDTEDYRKLFEN